MGRDPPFKVPRKSRRCRHFDNEGNPKRRDECDFPSADCWFVHPDDPEWDGLPWTRLGGNIPKGPAADYGGRRRRGGARSRSRSRSRSRERERDRGWGERGRERPYQSRSRSPPRRPDSLASSHASAVHGPSSPERRPREPQSHRASINDNNENNNSPRTSIRPFVAPSSPALSLPPQSPAQPQQPAPPLPPPGSPNKLFAPFQRIRPETVDRTATATANPSPTTTVSALTVPPQPPAVTAATTTTDLTDVHPATPADHSSLSPTIPGLTSSIKELPVPEKMSVTSLEEGQVAETPTLPPMPPLLPVPILPDFEDEATPTIEISQEAKTEMWNKRIQTFAELLAYKDKIQGLEADIDDLTRYSTSATFTAGSEEKERIQSNLEELASDRETAMRDIQKGLDELAIGSASSDTTAAEWPSPLDIAEAQKKNDKVKEYVVGLADVMKEVSLTLKGLEEFMDKYADERKKSKERRRSEKGKEKEAVVDDAMDIDKEGVSTAEAVSIPSRVPHPVAEGQREEREGAGMILEIPSSSSSSRSLEISKIRAKFEVLETSIQNVAISLEQTESSWMQGVKELFQDLVLKQKKTVKKHVGKQKRLIEQHATQLKSSLGQVSDDVNATNAKMQNVADETSQAIEKINRLERERDSLLEGHKKFFEEELPGLKESFREYEAQRAEDKKRMGALEAALNAFINRPPGEPRNLINGAMAISKVTSTIMTSVATVTSSEGVPSPNQTKTIQTPTPTTPCHPPTPPTPSLPLQQSFLVPASFPSSTTVARPTASSSNDTAYFIQNIKPIIIPLLREAVKPLLEEVRQKVEEKVAAHKEEMYTNVWSKMHFTWQILGKIEQRTESDLMEIYNRATTSGRGGMDGCVEDVEGKENEGSSGRVVNGDVRMDVDSSVNASSTVVGAPPTSAQ